MVDMKEKDTSKKAALSGQITPTQESKEKTAKGKINYISEEVERIINRDLAEGQLKGDYASRTKYHLDGTCELNLWENERCQIISCECHTNPTTDCQGQMINEGEVDLDITSVKTLNTVHLQEIEEIKQEDNLDTIQLKINQ